MEQRAGLLLEGHLPQQILHADPDRVSAVFVWIELPVLVQIAEREPVGLERVGRTTHLLAGGVNRGGPAVGVVADQPEQDDDDCAHHIANYFQCLFHTRAAPRTENVVRNSKAQPDCQ